MSYEHNIIHQVVQGGLSPLCFPAEISGQVQFYQHLLKAPETCLKQIHAKFGRSTEMPPSIQNSILHGLAHKEGKGFIKIFVREEDNVLKCAIEDNGIGREKALKLKEKAVMKRKSMGLKITEERLKLLSKENLQELIRITDLKDTLNHAIGTRVNVSIPIHS